MEVWGSGGGGGGAACGNSGMDLKQVEVAYRGLPGVKAEPGVSHGHQPLNGHLREWMGGGAGSPSPGAAAQPQSNGYSSPLSTSSYGPYSPNGKIVASKICNFIAKHDTTNFSTPCILTVSVEWLQYRIYKALKPGTNLMSRAEIKHIQWRPL
ncbi:unnamed protein product [Plutella xylostella]|uniref:(diamondback moth) hypothetical protein n=1 Tax=Plutella xylostella TaxID=51655 RepID=A0A8S4EG61_PLUXY|nr:unnamed protein product [Plutella xylostella]